MKDMTKMDKIWVATATLIYPHTECTYLVSKLQIIQKIKEIFQNVRIDKVQTILSTMRF